MAWTGDEIKDLRLKLGWSRAELGRRLGLNLDQTFQLEAGGLPMDGELISELDVLSDHLDTQSRNIKVKGLSVEHMKKASVTQASSDEVEEFAKETKLK